MSARSVPLVAALLLAGSPAVAQVLRGTVLDSASGGPVLGARIAVLPALGEAGTTVGIAVTGADGVFTFRLPARGQYMVRISRIGYLTRITPPISVTSAGDASVEIRVSAAPVPLDTLIVRAVSVPFVVRIPFLEEAGFYERRRQGIGHFLTRADLDQHPADRMTNAFYGISGVHVVCEGANLPAGTCDVQAPGSTTMFKRGVCKPSVVLDGVVLRSGGVRSIAAADPMPKGIQDATVDELLNPFNIEAVEVYTSPAGVPVQYKGYLSPCGAIIAWSRR